MSLRWGAEFAGPENDGPKIFNSWKMPDLENDLANTVGAHQSIHSVGTWLPSVLAEKRTKTFVAY